MPRSSCHVCGRQIVKPWEAAHDLPRITSDCQPWSGRYQIGVCGKCGLVQTILSKQWFRDCASIYGQYQIYPQTIGRTEQKIFSTKRRRLIPRSDAIVAHLKANKFFAKRKLRVVEIGAGAGFLLKSIANEKLGTELSAVERSPDCIRKIKELRVVRHVYRDLDQIGPKVDRMILIHTLEHIPKPLAFLRRCSSKLGPKGLVFIQVPNTRSNPFLLTVADHCSHFTPSSLLACMERAGFKKVSLAKLFGGKEIAGIFCKKEESEKSRACQEKQGWLIKSLRNLQLIQKMFLKTDSPISLFGTSLGATWILSQFRDKVACLLDEDPARVGRKFMGVPILHPRSLQKGVKIFSTVPFTRANNLKKKLRKFTILHAR